MFRFWSICSVWLVRKCKEKKTQCYNVFYFRVNGFPQFYFSCSFFCRFICLVDEKILEKDYVFFFKFLVNGFPKFYFSCSFFFFFFLSIYSVWLVRKCKEIKGSFFLSINWFLLVFFTFRVPFVDLLSVWPMRKCKENKNSGKILIVIIFYIKNVYRIVRLMGFYLVL